MIIENNSLQEWEISSFIDFIQKFNLQEQILKDFEDIDDIQEVYESNNFISDNDHIQEYLEKMEDNYTMDFIETRNDDYWLIKKVEIGLKFKVVDSEDVERIYELDSFINMLNNQFDLMSFEVLK